VQQTSAVGIFTRRGGQLWCFGLWGGGLVSFLKVSSLSALPMARSRRLRGWGRNFPFRRTSLHSHPLLKVPCSAVETVHRILSASGLSSPNGYPLSADNPGQTSHVMLYKGTSSSTAGPSRFHARNKKEGGSARCSGFDFRGAAESSSASCYILELSCGLVGESFGRLVPTGCHRQTEPHGRLLGVVTGHSACRVVVRALCGICGRKAADARRWLSARLYSKRLSFCCCLYCRCGNVAPVFQVA